MPLSTGRRGRGMALLISCPHSHIMKLWIKHTYSNQIHIPCRGVATGGISVFIPPKSAQVNFLWGKNDVRTAIQQFYTHPPPQKKLLYPQNKFLATPLIPWLLYYSRPLSYLFIPLRVHALHECMSVGTVHLRGRFAG